MLDGAKKKKNIEKRKSKMKNKKLQGKSNNDN